MQPSKLAQFLDHTLLKPTATEAEIVAAAEEAVQHRFYSLCIEKRWLPLVRDRLNAVGVLPITVLAFPTGEGSPDAKRREAEEALALGARELDMVIDKKAASARQFSRLYEEIRGVVDVAGKVPVKTILETAEFEADEIAALAAVAASAGVAFVKTSTGFGRGGASLEAVRILRRIVGPHVGVKASGGVRTTQDAMAFLDAGANRLGTSASVAIVSGLAAEGSGY